MSKNNSVTIDFCNSLLYDKIAEYKEGNTSQEVSDWFNSQELENSIVTCSKLKVKFHKKHCDILKFLKFDNRYLKSDKFKLDFVDCNPFVCNIAKEISKTKRTTKKFLERMIKT